MSKPKPVSDRSVSGNGEIPEKLVDSPDSSQTNTAGKSRPKSRQSKAKQVSTDGLGELLAATDFAELIHLQKQELEARTTEERQAYLKQIRENYWAITSEFGNSADACIDLVIEMKTQHRKWRMSMIVATGILAIINIISAYTRWESAALLAAAYAAGLAIFSNLEAFGNFYERAQSYRQSRELYLDAYREAELAWPVFTGPFGESAEACARATIAYRRLVERDRALRVKIKELTEKDKISNTQSK